MKNIALFLAVYGHIALAALPDSCQEGDLSSCNSAGDKCTTPQNFEVEPAGTGQVWFSHCCTVSDSDTSMATATAPVSITTSKEYCYAYVLKGYSTNQFHNIKPACSENGSGNLAWTLEGQCKKDGVSSSS